MKVFFEHEIDIIILNLPKNVFHVHFNPSHPKFRTNRKIKLNFHFHTSLWCFKRFYEGLKEVLKKINLFFILVQLSEIHWTLRAKWLRFPVLRII